MLKNKERFTQLMSEIVHAEMNEDEQSIFSIEGEEWIDELLVATQSRQTTGIEVKGMSMGISPQAMDIIKTVCSCGALIVSCITLYLNYTKDKAGHLKGSVERLEAVKKLRGLMEEQKMSPELIEAINSKYAIQIINVLDDIS